MSVIKDIPNILEGCDTKNICGIVAFQVQEYLHRASSEGWVLYRIDSWDCGARLDSGKYGPQLPGHLYYSLALRRKL